MTPLILGIMSVTATASGVAVGIIWSRRRLPPDPHKHLWGQWGPAENEDHWCQQRECLSCGELQARKATPL